ncbi:hypothetical protein CEXT_115951 [Caerostris extrusa]|uniref:Uncharacterized protein n=1 Tax=Caerostris extrusa TaxID=172846 RepID=A0AAV4WJS4_CAEEX|nr:hypothetical protein CEXT_115951 [Caerostris extrusa]
MTRNSWIQRVRLTSLIFPERLPNLSDEERCARITTAIKKDIAQNLYGAYAATLTGHSPDDDDLKKITILHDDLQHAMREPMTRNSWIQRVRLTSLIFPERLPNLSDEERCARITTAIKKDIAQNLYGAYAATLTGHSPDDDDLKKITILHDDLQHAMREPMTRNSWIQRVRLTSLIFPERLPNLSDEERCARITTAIKKDIAQNLYGAYAATLTGHSPDDDDLKKITILHDDLQHAMREVSELEFCPLPSYKKHKINSQIKRNAPHLNNHEHDNDGFTMHSKKLIAKVNYALFQLLVSNQLLLLSVFLIFPFLPLSLSMFRIL